MARGVLAAAGLLLALSTMTGCSSCGPCSAFCDAEYVERVYFPDGWWERTRGATPTPAPEPARADPQPAPDPMPEAVPEEDVPAENEGAEMPPTDAGDGSGGLPAPPTAR